MGKRRRSESADNDNARTRSLLDAADAAFEEEPESEFTETVMSGLMSDAMTEPYPPTGHGYPRR